MPGPAVAWAGFAGFFFRGLVFRCIGFFVVAGIVFGWVAIVGFFGGEGGDEAEGEFFPVVEKHGGDEFFAAMLQVLLVTLFEWRVVVQELSQLHPR
jgi:hypothetical protein